jgi:hypothetical protein
MEAAVRDALIIVVSACCASVHAQTGSRAGFHPEIPKTWDDAAIPTLEIPLGNPTGSPKHVSSDYYYKIPVRPIYKTYPVYAPGHEPPGYMDWLKQQEPQVIWDNASHRPPLQKEADWIKAGEIVFDASIGYQGVRSVVTNLRRAKSHMVGQRRGPVSEGRHCPAIATSSGRRSKLKSAAFRALPATRG